MKLTYRIARHMLLHPLSRIGIYSPTDCPTRRLPCTSARVSGAHSLSTESWSVGLVVTANDRFWYTGRQHSLSLRRDNPSGGQAGRHVQNSILSPYLQPALNSLPESQPLCNPGA